MSVSYYIRNLLKEYKFSSEEAELLCESLDRIDQVERKKVQALFVKYGIQCLTHNSGDGTTEATATDVPTVAWWSPD